MSVRTRWSSQQGVALLLPKSRGDSFLLPSPLCLVLLALGSGEWLGMVFCVGVIIVGLRKACASRSVVSGGLSWWMPKFGEGSWCQANN